MSPNEITGTLNASLMKRNDCDDFLMAAVINGCGLIMVIDFGSALYRKTKTSSCYMKIIEDYTLWPTHTTPRDFIRVCTPLCLIGAMRIE